MGTNKRLSKHGDNNLPQYRKTLIDDFFLFCDGHPEKMGTIVYKKDIESPMPPSSEQMGKMLNRLNIIWTNFCKALGVQNIIYGTFISEVKKQWLQKGEIQKQQQIVKASRERKQ